MFNVGPFLLPLLFARSHTVRGGSSSGSDEEVDRGRPSSTGPRAPPYPHLSGPLSLTISALHVLFWALWSVLSLLGTHVVFWAHPC